MKIAPPKIITDLVDRFRDNFESYHSAGYNEAQVRKEFIDPMFKALGWDIDNEKGYAEAYKEVIHEDSIKVAGATKAPDYCFRIGGTRKFFLEAKRPLINIYEEMSPAYQLRRYAWSAKLPLSILFNFEKFVVYDCRIKPALSDKASAARIFYLNYMEYIDNWEKIALIFSPEQVLKGSFDRFVETTASKRGTAEVDDAFLAEIETWREKLARNIALRNSRLDQRALNYAVQIIIDRIIFLRICEDRGIENYGNLQALLNGANIYGRLRQLFNSADQKYNSGLFYFEEEKGRPGSPDILTPDILVDDKVLKEIIRRLYYPDSPYEFSVLPAEILGQVYEQFLGKIIRLTKAHQARIEEKPEVRKAGGVYYTPNYIVDYIVNKTIGMVLNGKKPGPRGEVSGLRILDPACGSGSFLLGAYQYLLDWHFNQYIENEPEKWAKGKNPAIYRGSNGEWRLTIAERKRILLNNIFGVDIDSQAVEVTKLSLLLKVLEGENAESLGRTYALFHQRALPDLGNNIKCGNSLVGSNYYNGRGLALYGNEEVLRINAFDWKKEFKRIIGKAGFDIVIGNPPWGSYFSRDEKEYLNEMYVSHVGESESHLYFIEKGLRLLKPNGILGFITPNTWLSVKNSEQIRKLVLINCSIYEIFELSKYIFRDAPDIVPILIFFRLAKNGRHNTIVKRANKIKVTQVDFNQSYSEIRIRQSSWAKNSMFSINLRAESTFVAILQKCKKNTVPLSSLCDVKYGIKTGDNSKFLSKTKTANHNIKALKTGELSRFKIQWKGYYLWWSADLAGYREEPIAITKIIVQYIRKISLNRRIIAALDERGYYYPLNNYSYIITRNKGYSIKYVLGVINSSLMNFIFANTFVDYNIKPTYLKQLPIKSIDFDNIADKSKYDQIVALVDRIHSLNKEDNIIRAAYDKNIINRQIETMDHQIDNLVYQLYGLTADEIKIVEGDRAIETVD